MAADSPVPQKRARSASINQLSSNLAVVECIREFKLPQAYPSMAKYANKGSNMMIQKTKANESANFIANISKDVQLSTKLQKLKLKSPDGRDLGEFNVQILPQTNNNNKNKTVAVALNLPKAHEANNVVSKSDDSGKYVHVTQTVKSMPSQSQPAMRYLTKSVKLEVPDRTQGVLIPISSNMVPAANLDNASAVADQQKNKMFVVQPSKNGWQLFKNDVTATNVPVLMKRNDEKKDVAIKPKVKIISQEKKQFIRTPINYKDDIVYSGAKRKVNGTYLAPVIKDKKFVNVGSSNIVMKLEGVDEENDLGDNMVFVVPDDSENESNNTEPKRQYLRNSHGTVNLIRRGRKEAHRSRDSVESPNSILKNTSNYSSNNTSNYSSNDTSNYNSSYTSTYTSPFKDLPTVMSNEDISSKLSIVSQALNTIDDENLKAKALKALADCGLGLEKFIPVKPPPDLMAIRESQTQTHVFGLFDKRDFIKITAENDPIVHLHEIEKIQVVEESKPQNKTQQVQNDALTFSKENLDEMLDGICVNKSNREKMQQLLKFNPITNKIYRLLENDFKNCKEYDKDGLLKIHNAVLSNNERLVKRQIMVLTNCKESIDLPTTDGETSLELALRHEMSSTIVNMLLKAGASPTSSESAHDSALTVASNKSLDILFELVKYVKSNDPGINNVDSEGFTALHYCAINGNSNGIAELICINADLNARDCKSGRTALFHALENEYLDICKTLLLHGAKGNIPNFAGQTVFTLFDEDKHFILKEYLQK